MKNVVVNYCLCSLFLITLSCKKNIETSVLNQKAFDQTNHWIVQEKTNATKDDNTYSWNFEVEHPAEYILQIVSNPDSFQENGTAKIKLVTYEFEAPLLKNYVTHSNEIVSEFKKKIQLKNKGKQTVSITTVANFKKLRILPYYRNPIASGKHHEEWLQMHNSPEKKRDFKMV